MAEILISLTIIGVIAAITLPSLRANINETTWNTQRKALYSRMSQAISMMPSLNGYGEYTGEWADDSVTVSEDTAAVTFVTDGLSKVLQINNICSVPYNASSEDARKELKKCGISNKIKTIEGNNYSFPTKMSELNPGFMSGYTGLNGTYYPNMNPQKNVDTRVAAFELKNGESVAVFYNKYCLADVQNGTYRAFPPDICANFIYDLNGRKGPNQVGKDIGFITALYAVDSDVVAPMPLHKQMSGAFKQDEAAGICRNLDTASRVANRSELKALAYNMKLLLQRTYGDYWSSTILSGDSTKAWMIHFPRLVEDAPKRITPTLVYCIKR